MDGRALLGRDAPAARDGSPGDRRAGVAAGAHMRRITDWLLYDDGLPLVLTLALLWLAGYRATWGRWP